MAMCRKEMLSLPPQNTEWESWGTQITEDHRLVKFDETTNSQQSFSAVSVGALHKLSVAPDPNKPYS